MLEAAITYYNLLELIGEIMDSEEYVEVLKRMLELRREPDAIKYHTVLEEQQALDYAIRCIEENGRLREQINQTTQNREEVNQKEGTMRDIKRIKRICRLLEDKWSKVPDQRLGQFLANYVFGHHTDPFYLEDGKTEKRLEEI